MNKLITKLISKKIVLNGQTVFQPPNNGLKKKIYDYFDKKKHEQLLKKLQNFEISALENVLFDIADMHKNTNHVFLIDLVKYRWIELQIFYPVMTFDIFKDDKLRKFGYIIFWTFDSSTKKNLSILNRFKQHDIYSNFTHFILEDVIDCYAYNCGKNITKTMEIIEIFLLEIIGYPRGTKYYFFKSDMGNIENISEIS